MRIAEMIIFLLLCLCFATKNYEVEGWMPNLSKNEDLALEKLLKVINKPAIKTIQTEYGHIVDCIDIHKQLAFDNPLLKNHKIKLKPSFQDTATKAKVHDRSDRLSKIGLGKILCPRGTVPVRRTTKEDLLLENLLSNNIGIKTSTDPGKHFAEVHTNYGKIYFGIRGTLSVYNPSVAKDQMSGAYIWVSNGTKHTDLNSIQTGWQVYPDLSGDNRTHFFASWSNGLQGTGCTNLLCAGFVQTGQTIYLGAPVSNTSIYEGPQFEMSLSLTLDPDNFNWWLSAQNVIIGYFPRELFSNNLLCAHQAGWTGTTLTTNWTSPPMGSGHLPDDNFQHACYISRMTVIDDKRQELGPTPGMVDTYSDNHHCYDVKYYSYYNHNLQCAMQFGGPGGDCRI